MIDTPSLIILATGNAGKLKEIHTLLQSSGIQVAAQNEFNVPEADETGLSFIENALIKARNAAQYTGHPAIADDSGLAVDALNGAPGIYSARYAGQEANASDNIAKLLQALQGIPEARRRARFHCAAVYVQHKDDPAPLVFHATWEGRILTKKVGNGGFGYDPVFYLDAQQCTSAELPSEIKNQLSHRGQAVKQLINTLIQTFR